MITNRTNRTNKMDSSLTNTQFLSPESMSSKPIEVTHYFNFQQVLLNSEDQITVRKLLIEHVPVDVQIKITQLFNQEHICRQIIRNDKI